MATSDRCARELELETRIIPQKKAAVEDAKVGLDESAEELARLKLDKTDRDATIRQLMKVKKMNRETAIEAIALKAKGYDI